VITSAACDSEGEARKMMEKFVRIGVRGPWELTLALYSWLPEVHPQDKSIGANSTALNQLLADRLGRSAMLSSQTLLRLMALLTVESSDGASGLLFTAPHGVFVHRPGHADHKPEVYTTFLAVAFAELTGSSYAVWSASERCKSDIRSAPDTANIDPNYAAESNLSELPWNRILSRHVRRFRAAGGRSIKPKGFVGNCTLTFTGVETLLPARTEVLMSLTATLASARCLTWAMGRRTKRLLGDWRRRSSRLSLKLWRTLSSWSMSTPRNSAVSYPAKITL
jgi:hypothetical protein